MELNDSNSLKRSQDEDISSLLLLLKSNQNNNTHSASSSMVSSTGVMPASSSSIISNSTGQAANGAYRNTTSQQNNNTSNVSNTVVSPNSSFNTNMLTDHQEVDEGDDDDLGDGTNAGEVLDSRHIALLRLLTISELRRYFHLPMQEVAKQLGVCTTLLKKICRKNLIKRWPYRQIRSITKSIHSLEIMHETVEDSDKNRVTGQIQHLQNTLDVLLQDPNAPVSEIKFLRSTLLDDMDDLDALPHSSAHDADSAGGYNAAAAADNFLQGDLSSVEPSSRSASVTALMIAAASSSTAHATSDLSKYKKRRGEGATDGEHHDNEAFHLGRPVVGATQVNYLVVNESYGRKLHFLAPVHLAPLVRKKVKTSKRFVPLIEPDICNYMKMDFLPEAVLMRADQLPDISSGGDAGDTSGGSDFMASSSL